MKYFKYIGLFFLVLSTFYRGYTQTVTLTVNNSSIPENSSGTITATLNTASSTETIISFAPSGSANLDGDYSVSYTGKGSIVVVAGPTSNLSNGNGSAITQSKELKKNIAIQKESMGGMGTGGNVAVIDKSVKSNDKTIIGGNTIQGPVRVDGMSSGDAFMSYLYRQQ